MNGDEEHFSVPSKDIKVDDLFQKDVRNPYWKVELMLYAFIIINTKENAHQPICTNSHVCKMRKVVSMRAHWVKIGQNGDAPPALNNLASLEASFIVQNYMLWRMIMPMAFKLWMAFNANV